MPPKRSFCVPASSDRGLGASKETVPSEISTAQVFSSMESKQKNVNESVFSKSKRFITVSLVGFSIEKRLKEMKNV